MYTPQVKKLEQAMVSIRRYALEHGLKAGDRLPSERDFCDRFGIGRGAVNKAVACLISSGFVRREGYKLWIAAPSTTPESLTQEPLSPIHVISPFSRLDASGGGSNGFLDGLRDAAERNGGLIVPIFSDGRDLARQVERIVAERVDGFILWPTPGVDFTSVLANADAVGIPFVVCDLIADTCDFVGVDNEAGARLAVKHLVEQRHRNVAFMGWEMRASSVAQRYRGYQLACREFDIPRSAQQLITVPIEHDAKNLNLAELLLASYPNATAVFCSTDYCAELLQRSLQNRGYSIPTDMSIVGFDDEMFARHLNPPLTTIAQKHRDIGYLACELLYRRLRQKLRSEATSPIRIKLEPTLVFRSSTAPRRRTPRP